MNKPSKIVLPSPELTVSIYIYIHARLSLATPQIYIQALTPPPQIKEIEVYTLGIQTCNIRITRGNPGGVRLIHF